MVFKQIKNKLAGKKATETNKIELFERYTEIPSQLVKTIESKFIDSFDISKGCNFSEEEISEKCKDFFWHYPLSFGKVKADLSFTPFTQNRHQQRYNHIFPALVHASGGSFAGKTILDCGCNCGFWSIQAMKHNADSVLGFDAGEGNIDQANFIKEIIGLERVQYEVMDLNELSLERLGRQFDITFFFGLLYHLNTPIEIFRGLKEVTKEFAVVDTQIALGEEPLMYVLDDFAHEQNKSNELRFLPTLNAVCKMLLFVGFSRLVLVPNRSEDLPEDYLNGKRVTILAYI